MVSNLCKEFMAKLALPNSDIHKLISAYAVTERLVLAIELEEIVTALFEADEIKRYENLNGEKVFSGLM